MRRVTKAIIILSVFDSFTLGGVAVTYANASYDTPTKGLSQTAIVDQNLTSVSPAPVVSVTTAAPTKPVPTKTTTKPKKTTIVNPLNAVDSSSPTIDPTDTSTPAATPASNRHEGNVVPGEPCPDTEHNWSGLTGAGKVVYCVLLNGIWQWSK